MSLTFFTNLVEIDFVLIDFFYITQTANQPFMSRYTVALHRRFSMLAYYPIEAIARCPPPAIPETVGSANTPDCQVHTSKVLLAIERFDALLTVPTNAAAHSPFVICMIANMIKTHLVACRSIYQGHQLRMARERIRVSMGSLRTLGEYWLLGKRSYQEVGVIAREVLSLGRQEGHSGAQEELPIQNLGVVELSPPLFLWPDNLFQFRDASFHETADPSLV